MSSLQAMGNGDREARVILLGASNLARGVALAAETARIVLGGPLELVIAMGHGRSYGVRSRVLGRALPGIAECGLWDALKRTRAHPTYALLTDVGNDLAYGAPVEEIEGWIALCLDRLAAAGSRTVLTLLPMASLESLSPLRFGVARSILFPARRIAHRDAIDAARRLDERLRRLGESRGATLVEQPRDWYGLDPIHLRPTVMPQAWRRILAAWRPGADAPPARRSLRRFLAIRRLTPQRWWLAGIPLGRPQPAGTLADGSRVWLF
jgi:hypothetical protein